MLEINNVYKKFNLEDGLFAGYGKFVYAVNNISLHIKKGETYGLVGESGCGKSTLSRLIAGIYKQDSGEIKIKLGGVSYNQGVANDNASVLALRQGVRYIFQDPAKSLDPRMNVGEIIVEGFKYTQEYKGKKDALRRTGALLESVGLSEKDISRRPGEFSGGQRQRISIARALITKPEILICDEVVSALDVSVQSQIINLLIDIKTKENITIVFISHDLGLVSYISDRVGVMYGGMIVEELDAEKIVDNHKHPYTTLLYSSLSGKMKVESIIQNDEVANITTQLTGCPFYQRCTKRIEICHTMIPELKPVSNDSEHKIACFVMN
ncbi:MAG: hypothetical protein A2015_15200 [Spirochaetes bacterium GWF1_31_7]|nr:MAG: hypothetical protein A2Y30_11625 [Spirochaetes bacterium GWE1_32_154]OHD51167.1 MAG: hypothetical protein A2Y29_01165 [Spirochaetes bacterium GWE2_31_10]OHD52086.1 MAG: hypothetical protein A2015_15200 [Spirochaetes bacterium GWF1_31_7]OHD81030.1 MAG: hypothetical protein A2355_11160 [Spirochaetes bacterium RIFOXYB1_FULL_32_8]